MIPLDQHNSQIRAIYQADVYPKKNGIECPVCKSEMSDIDNLVLTSMPPQKRIKCEECGHYAFAVI